MATDTVTAPKLSSGKTPLRADDRPQRIKVCHVSMTLLTGGLERLLVDYGRYHDADKYDLRFVALDTLGPPADELREMGFAVDTLNFSSRGKLSVLSGLRQIFRDEQIDVVHTHNTYPHFYASFAAKLSGVSVVVNSQHGRGCGNGWKDRLQFRLANRIANHVVGVSDDATELCRQQDRVSASKISCIWNGIDLKRFQYHGPANQRTAISVARLSQEKDYPTLLRGIAIALPKVPDFRLMLVGDGAERTKLEELAKELDITHAVEFLGERKDVPQLLSQAGFFVSSSKTEGISLTLLEAMAVGLPILTTRVGGNPEIVDDPATGKLVEPLNPDAIAAGIIEMCERQSEWKIIGAAGRERVEQNFEITKMIRAYEQLYCSCMTPQH